MGIFAALSRANPIARQFAFGSKIGLDSAPHFFCNGCGNSWANPACTATSAPIADAKPASHTLIRDMPSPPVFFSIILSFIQYMLHGQARDCGCFRAGSQNLLGWGWQLNQWIIRCPISKLLGHRKCMAFATRCVILMPLCPLDKMVPYLSRVSEQIG